MGLVSKLVVNLIDQVRLDLMPWNVVIYWRSAVSFVRRSWSRVVSRKCVTFGCRCSLWSDRVALKTWVKHQHWSDLRSAIRCNRTEAFSVRSQASDVVSRHKCIVVVTRRCLSPFDVAVFGRYEIVYRYVILVFLYRDCRFGQRLGNFVAMLDGAVAR